MSSATYSLLTLRPDPERIDMLCVGVVILDATGNWHVSAPGPKEKLLALGADSHSLARMSVNLVSVLNQCFTLADARTKLAGMRSALAIHGFEGLFSYDSDAEFSNQLQAILSESVLPAARPKVSEKVALRVIRPRTRARLRRQFENMGIMAKHADEISDHKVVRNYPVSAKHGLVAEFALKNTVMHLTETVDFEVVEDGMRTKVFEAQAKCLVMRSALDTFGKNTKCHFVLSGSGTDRAARSVDLLSTAGTLYAIENSTDMANYFEAMARASNTTGQISAD